MIIMVIGGIIALVGNITFIVRMFQTSVVWGLAGLFIPFVSLIWLVMHLDKGGKPFLMALGGAVLMGMGAAMSGAMAGAH